MKRILTTLVLVALLTAASPALATTTYSLLQGATGTAAPAGYSRYFDVIATTDANLASQEMILQANSGDIFQSEFGADTGPPSGPLIALYPEVEWDSYVTLPVSFSASGWAVDLGSTGPKTFDTQLLDITWSPTGGSHTGAGTHTIARFTVADWFSGTYKIGGFEEGATPPWTEVAGTISMMPVVLAAPVIVPGAPSGYETRDFYANIMSDMGAMELKFETYSGGAIYQNGAAPDNPSDPFSSYVTVGYPAAGAQDANTTIFGGAVDIGGGTAVTFTTSGIDIAWVPTGGVKTGRGDFHVARITSEVGINARYTLIGYQADDESNPVTITGVIDTPMTTTMVDVAGAPAGYQSYDFFVNVTTDVGAVELILGNLDPGDVYQNGAAADNPSESFASYVTVGYPAAGAQDANTTVFGGAVDIGGGTAASFDTAAVDITWGPTGGVKTGSGSFHVARITLRNDAFATYKLKAWKTKGLNDSTESILVEDGELIGIMPGDTNRDGLVSGLDLSVIITNWGKTGQTRADGDLNGDGTVEGNDYSEVLSNWGFDARPPEPPSVPEPTTLLILAGAALVGLVRRR